SLNYYAALFKKETINRIIGYFKNLLTIVTAEPGKRIAALDIMPEEEKHRILIDFNETATAYPKEKTLHRLFEEQAARTPDRISIVGKMWEETGDRDTRTTTAEPNTVTYKELNERAARLAGLLIEKGVKTNTIVALLMERTIEMMVAIMGILKAGGAYLPIDPTMPPERKQYMLRDSNAGMMLTTRSLAKELSYEKEKVYVEEWETYEERQKEAGAPPAPGEHAAAIAYVIYTSGSTGKPKGNLTKHYNVSRVVKETAYIDITEDDSLLQLSNYAFDGSVFDIFGALLNGARLVMIGKEDLLEMDRLSGVIKKERI
ncbi:MAG: AMP-binding protein, partial [bacterium]|nr:AMP-binding protein [bacterium]